MRVFTEEHKRKISESRKEVKHWNYGKTFSEETKKKMSVSIKKAQADGKKGTGMLGKKHNENTKEKIRALYEKM